MLNVIKPLTYKSRLQQIGDGNKFFLEDNEVFATYAGIIFAPRYTYTDNITFINNTFVDVRASHIHDIGCATHKLLISNLTEQDLKNMGLLYLNEKATERECKFLEQLKKAGRYKGNTDVSVYVCEDIPIEYIEAIDVSFAENNRLFKEMLKVTNVGNFKSNIMGSAVYLNAGWALKKVKPMLEPEQLYKELLVT